MTSRAKATDGLTQAERQRRFDALDELHKEWVAGVDQDYVARAAQIQAIPNNHDDMIQKVVSYEDELGLGGEDEPVRHIIDPKKLAEELEVLWIKSNLPRTTPNEAIADDKTSASSSGPEYSEAQTQAQTQQETSVCQSKNTFSPEHMDDFLAEIAAWSENKKAEDDANGDSGESEEQTPRC